MSDTAPTTAPAAPAAPAAPQAPAAPAAPPAPTTAPTAPATAPAPPAPPAPAAPAGEPQDVASLPDWAQTLIRDTRAEAAQWRTRAQGTAPQGEPGTPPAVEPPPGAPQQGAEGDLTRLPRWAQQAVTDGQGAARTLAVQSAVIAAAPAAGADIARLLDSSSAMRALSAVDPADTAAVTAAIQAALTAQPHLAAGGFTPGRAGAEFHAPTGEVTPQQFAAMDYAARAELYQTNPDTYRRLAG
ncbi:hypothetical protein [Streptomyces nigra]|uniref:hypothetical protein n=1 Tax=Streptomyces nigra TaxID=1827580 RepID=UPI0037FB0688